MPRIAPACPVVLSAPYARPDNLDGTTGLGEGYLSFPDLTQPHPQAFFAGCPAAIKKFQPVVEEELPDLIWKG